MKGRHLSALTALMLAACAVPDRPTAGGSAAPSTAPVVIDSQGFQDDGSYWVPADGASPAFLLSPPLCSCTMPALGQFSRGSTSGIPFTAMLEACAEEDAAIEVRNKAALPEAKRASNYQRVAECVATRLHLGCLRSAASVVSDPCPALLGSGWHPPQKQALERLSDRQRVLLGQELSRAGDGIFSSLTVLAADGENDFFAADVSSNGQMAPVWSRPSPATHRPDPSNFRAAQPFAIRCVRTAEDHRPPPTLSSTAESCLTLASLGKPGPRSEREQMSYNAAREQLARPLYQPIVAFRAMADRVRTVPDLDVAALRRELTALEPTLQRIRDYFERKEALIPRYFEVTRELEEVRAAAQIAPVNQRVEVERRKNELQKRVDALLLENYADDGELRNAGAITEALRWLEARILADEQDLSAIGRALRQSPTPLELESRRKELAQLLYDLRASDPHRRNLGPNPNPSASEAVPARLGPRPR